VKLRNCSLTNSLLVTSDDLGPHAFRKQDNLKFKQNLINKSNQVSTWLAPGKQFG